MAATLHYFLAHKALSQIALSGPFQFLEIMHSPKAPHFLDSVILKVCADIGVQPHFGSPEITITPQTVNNFPCIVLEFPEPQEQAEAHMVALVLLADRSAEISDAKTVPGRYFTLEKSMDVMSGEPQTVFGEWTNNKHLNRGTGPDPSVDAFVSAIKEVV